MKFGSGNIHAWKRRYAFLPTRIPLRDGEFVWIWLEPFWERFNGLCDEVTLEPPSGERGSGA